MTAARSCSALGASESELSLHWLNRPQQLIRSPLAAVGAVVCLLLAALAPGFHAWQLSGDAVVAVSGHCCSDTCCEVDQDDSEPTPVPHDPHECPVCVLIDLMPAAADLQFGDAPGWWVLERVEFIAPEGLTVAPSASEHPVRARGPPVDRAA